LDRDRENLEFKKQFKIKYWELEKSKTKKGGTKMAKCGSKCEIYSRVTGYMRPINSWNKGKREEFKDRRAYTTLQNTVKANVA
jgi:hypothetical protein